MRALRGCVGKVLVSAFICNRSCEAEMSESWAISKNVKNFFYNFSNFPDWSIYHRLRTPKLGFLAPKWAICNVKMFKLFKYVNFRKTFSEMKHPKHRVFQISQIWKIKVLKYFSSFLILLSLSNAYSVISIDKLIPMQKTKCVGNLILLHLKFSKYFLSPKLTKFLYTYWPNLGFLDLFLKIDGVGCSDGRFFSQNHLHSIKKDKIQLFSAILEFVLPSLKSDQPLKTWIIKKEN